MEPKKWLIAVTIFTVLAALAFIFVFLVLLFPAWFPFQVSTFGANVATLALLLTALGTLVLALATFTMAAENRRIRAEDRELECGLRTFDENRRSLEEICNWAEKGIWAQGGTAQSIMCIHSVLALVALVVTNATGAHAIARAAHRSGEKPARAVVNDLEQKKEND